MKIIHIVPSVAEEASGPSYSVVRLCESLLGQQHLLTLVALDLKTSLVTLPFLKTFPIGFGPVRLGRSPGMYRWILERCLASDVEILHNHGMWQMNAVYPSWATGYHNVQLIYSPRGAFSEWAMRNGSNAKIFFWYLIQRPALWRANCFHATAKSEYEDIRRLRFRQPVAIIPNGIDIPEVNSESHGEFRTLLFLGRIHKKKGLDILLLAWREVQSNYPNWRIVIAGGDTGYSIKSGYLSEMQLLAKELGLVRIEFVGTLYGCEKTSAYQDAELFVLPTHSENFGMTVAESLAAGTPVIVSKGAPWEGLTERGAGWWIDIGVTPLVDCLKEAMSRTPAELAAMGGRGRLWMQRDFSWNGVSEKMTATYRWLCDKSLPGPPWVQLD